MKPLEVVPIPPPPEPERVSRLAEPALPTEKRNRYHLPHALESASPVGYRRRVSMSSAEADEVLPLLSLQRPSAFSPGPAVTEQELFEEASLGILSTRQATNFRGFQQVTFGPQDSSKVAALLRQLPGCEGAVLDNVAYTHVILSRPYRTPLTLLLTFIGHKPVLSLATTLGRVLKKRLWRAEDIPSVGYLEQLHIGFLGEAMMRAAVIASDGTRMAAMFSAPFCQPRGAVHKQLEALCGRKAGYRVALVAQVGYAHTEISRPLCRKLGANLMAFRSERIQPGVNAEASAPEQYRRRQRMDIPERLTEMAGRAAYNAFCFWSGIDRETAKGLLLLERIDVLTPDGKARIREVRAQLERINERILNTLPVWADLVSGHALSKNVARSKKAFALAGQRIYIGGLSKKDVADRHLNWDVALRAVGAAAARSGLYAELMGVVDVPPGCDLLGGVCMMVGPVNQNDIGKVFYGEKDLLARRFAERDPTSLLVWTLKAKTVADPIGHEEQLLCSARRGKLVDLRPAPHEVIRVCKNGQLIPMRAEPVNCERAFSDVGNFVVDGQGCPIAGNAGERYPHRLSPAFS